MNTDKLAINWQNFARVQIQLKFAFIIRPWGVAPALYNSAHCNSRWLVKWVVPLCQNDVL